MINEKALAENSTLYPSTELKAHATKIKRLAGGLRNLDADRLDLTDAEARTIASALALLGQASSVYAKASKLKATKEKRQAELHAEAIKLVQASEFARLTAVDDIVAFIATQASYLLQGRSIDDLWNARYLLEVTYKDCLEQHLAMDLTRQSMAPMPDKLSAAWAKFRELAPDLKLRYARLIQQTRNYLEADSQPSAKAVNSV